MKSSVAIRNRNGRLCFRTLLLAGLCAFGPAGFAEGLERLQYNNPGLVVDLSVGLWAWPIPVDFNGDGKLDLVVSCPDKPYNGTYFFENTGSDPTLPVFKPGVRIGKGLSNVCPSYVGSRVRVLSPSVEYPDFLQSGLDHGVKLSVPANIHPGKVRANQWKYVDYDGDGKRDLIVGVGDWTEYGWDNAFDATGKWQRGPLHSRVYCLRNTGSNEQPAYDKPVAIEAGGRPVDVFGMPSPNFADFDGDGDLDLICGEFLDGFTYFRNIGTRTAPKYAPGRRLMHDGQPIAMDLEMIVPVAVDWTRHDHTDLVVGQEDGRVALIENTGRIVDGVPQFLPPRFFKQQAADLKFGALVTPVGFDWDGDGKEDLVCGNSAGYIGFIKNLGGDPPRWAAPVYLEADGKPIRIMAGPNGSIQGPAEAKWGYTTLSVADWDGDGLPDLIVNSIWGKVVWYRNIGTRTQPKLAAAQPIEVEWSGPTPKPAWVWWNPAPKELVTQWRTTPVVFDLNGDGLPDLVMLDPEGYLAFFERARRNGKLVLLPGKRIFFGAGASVFDANGSVKDRHDGPLRLNLGQAGASGRRKFCIADWDGDGKPDLLVNSRNVNFLKNVSTKPGEFVFRDMGPVDDLQLAGHDTSPTVVHWHKDGRPDLVVGAEDGHFYYLPNPYRARKAQAHKPPAEHLVALWDFKPGHGGPLADKAPAGSSRDTLTALGDATVANGIGVVPGTAGAAFQAPDSDDLSPDQELTLWTRLRVEKGSPRIMSVIEKRRFQNPESRAYGLYLTPAGETAFGAGGQVSADGTAHRALAGGKSQPLPAGRWHELAMIVRRQGEGLAAEWLARDAAGEPWKRVNGPTANPLMDRIFHSRQPLLIGNDSNLKAGNSRLEFDEIRLYNRALSLDELAAIGKEK